MTVHPKAAAEVARIGQRLAIERLALGLTQPQVAEQIGAGQSLISRIEIGKASPLLDSVIAIADAVGLRLALVYDHQLPLLELTAAQVAALDLPTTAERPS